MFFRLGGRRCLTELTTFDVVLLLTIAEGMQQALLGPDYSVTYGLLVGVPLLLLDLALSWWQQPYPRVGKCPTVCQWPIVDDGPPRMGAIRRGAEGPPALAARLARVLSRARLTL